MITPKVIAVAVMLPFLIAPTIAQQHQGGPQSTVPHDMRQPKVPNVDNTANKKRIKPSKTRSSEGTVSQAGQHHYQGGPQSAVPHHIGDQPKATGDAPKRRTKAKRKKNSQT